MIDSKIISKIAEIGRIKNKTQIRASLKKLLKKYKSIELCAIGESEFIKATTKEIYFEFEGKTYFFGQYEACMLTTITTDIIGPKIVYKNIAHEHFNGYIHPHIGISSAPPPHFKNYGINVCYGNIMYLLNSMRKEKDILAIFNLIHNFLSHANKDYAEIIQYFPTISKKNRTSQC